MAEVSETTMVGSSQPAGQGTFVGTLNYSTDSGFRDGNPQSIGDGELWDKIELSDVYDPKMAPNGGRTTRSKASRLQTQDNTIQKIDHGDHGNRTDGSSKNSHGIHTNDGSRRSGGEGNAGNDGSNSSGGGSGERSGNGDGSNPHPGRSVGGGGNPGGPSSANVGAAALMAKLFGEPLKDPVPVGSLYLPCDTEEVRTEREGKGSQYSPVMWADPLFPINMKAGSNSSTIDVFPAVGCSVSNRFEAVTPELTQEGLLLKGIVDTEANPTILRSMVSIKGMKDLSALICLLETSRRTGFQAMKDEAPLIRLGLLMHCLAPAKWMAYTTSSVKNMCANGYPDMEGTTKTWTSAPSKSTSTEIGIESGASTLYWRTLGQYSRLISGSSTSVDDLLDDNKTVPVNSVKFIPVKMCWRGQSWLGPYILAHTTTKWWNHAVKVEIPVKIHNPKTASSSAVVTCMPKAATVYVPGSFKYICLVIVDVVEASFPTSEAFYVGNSYKATYAGNRDFGKIGHKIIGRNKDSPAVAASMVDCMAAWRVMCKSLLSHVNPGSIEVRLAVLATSRFCGFSVWTDSAKPTESGDAYCQRLLSEMGLEESDTPRNIAEWLELLRVAGDTGLDSDDVDTETNAVERERRVTLIKKMIDAKMSGMPKDDATKDHVYGVTCLDPKDDIKIGDHVIPDWFESYNTTATMPDRVKYYTWWRCDPLHRLSLAMVSCEDGSKPALEKFKSGEVQYELTEATDLVRILSYANIYQDNSACSGAIVEPIDILNRSLGFGSLLLALTELWRITSGVTLPDFNKLSTSWKLVDPDQWQIMVAATKEFVIFSPSTTNTAWTDKNFKITDVLKSQMGITDAKWLDHWYGGVLPWWYVQAVVIKFGGDVKLMTNKCVSVRLDVEEEWLDEEGYHVKANEAAPSDLAVLTSSLRYEMKVQRRAGGYFTILTPTKDGHNMKVHWTSWYYNYVNDLPKSGLRRQTRVEEPDFEGVVELNSITFAESRRFKGYANPEAFVDKNNRYLLPLDHTVYRGLTWPDPFSEWLKQGLIAIEPHLLNLDVVGAVGAALGHVNKTIIDWLNNKIHGDQSFRGGSD